MPSFREIFPEEDVTAIQAHVVAESRKLADCKGCGEIKPMHISEHRFNNRLNHCLSILFTIITSVLAVAGGDQMPATPQLNRASSASKSTVPFWFLGAWMRDWIKIKNDPPQGSTAVRDVQTPILYGDVRIPAARPMFRHAKSLEDLTNQELESLFQQDGFSGSTSFRGNTASWTHDISYGPVNGVDVGRLERISPSAVYESALDNSYQESWWSLSSGDGKYLGIKVATFSAGKERADRILTVAGDHFVFARNRPKDLPPAKSFADLVTKNHTNRATLIEYLDCEFSYGLVRGGKTPWEIQLSTLPWKEGTRLEFADQIEVNESTGKLSPRAEVRPGENWTVMVNTMKPHDLKAVFSPEIRQ